MSLCQKQPYFEHRFEWVATLDGGGYWLCLNELCGEVMAGTEDHNGG